MKRELPNMELTDSQMNMVARNYYTDAHFAKEDDGINMWRMYNLLTGANKSSYIDNFLDRSLNASMLAFGITDALQGGERYKWFIE